MVAVREITAKTIVTRSGIPGADYVINPYVGCTHGCLYCYARFMLRFAYHPEPWGRFVDAKVNAPDLVPQRPGKYRGVPIIMSSVTDCYQPVEKKYRLTRQVLERLLLLQPDLSILTKSDLAARDIDLLAQFRQLIVAASMSTLDDALARELEPGASPPGRRLAALRQLHEAGIRTAVFVSPILPGITDWREIIRKSAAFTDEFWFENLNLYSSIKPGIYGFLRKHNPDLVKEYEYIYSSGSACWDREEAAIREYGREAGRDFRIYFHHKRTR